MSVDLRDVSKRYGRRWALSHLTFAAKPGESILLTGHNGSGKTTLLRILATLASPTLGALQVLGFDAKRQREAIRQQTALLSHATFLYEDLSAEQNLLLHARVLGIGNAAEVIRERLERVGLGQRANQPVRQFSAGMRKRVSIARMLLKTPALALLDEPFGELDPAGITQMEGIIRGLKSAGATIFLATHLIEQGLSLCERRLHLEDGRAVAP